MPCDASGGSPIGIGYSPDVSSKNWDGAGNCINPYLCICSPFYAKYRCDANGSATKIANNSPDCCAYCNIHHPEPVAKLTLVDVVISPPTCTVDELVTITAHVSNSGTAAGSAKIKFYWSDGTVIGETIATPSIGVNTTIAATPVSVIATKDGTLSICAELVS
jgi:hypothetical protein